MENEPEVEKWTIKSVPGAQRDKAKACASRRGQTLGVWISAAIDTRAEIEAGDRVDMPGGVVQTIGPTIASPPTLSIDEIKSGLEAARLAADALGKPIPKGTAASAIALINAHYRAARGMPEIKRRPRERKVLTIDG